MSHQARRALVGVLALGLVRPPFSTAQGLGLVVAEFPRPIATIGGVVELPGGRVLVQRAAAYSLLDFAAGTETVTATIGQGPNDLFRSTGHMLLIRGDTVLITDSRARHYALVSPTGALVDWNLPLDDLLRGSVPVAVDQGTHLFGIKAATGYAGLVREALDSGAYETITTLNMIQPTRTITPSPSGTGMLVSFSLFPATLADVWGVLRDGTVMVARLDSGYHVEAIRPNGTRISGAPIPFDRVPTSPREREAGVGDYKSPVLFQIDRMGLTSPNGWFWVPRATALPGDSLHYDVFDTTATIVRHFTIPPKDRLIGFSATYAYVARPDTSGTERLLRYALPK